MEPSPTAEASFSTAGPLLVVFFVCLSVFLAVLLITGSAARGALVGGALFGLFVLVTGGGLLAPIFRPLIEGFDQRTKEALAERLAHAEAAAAIEHAWNQLLALSVAGSSPACPVSEIPAKPGLSFSH